ncbi:selenocysteine synthase [Microlunatus endophyticus]|uniref:Selenocysteine synthase n=1 Tax=Microlunatus endophyticus TaxID=1716077 RepID=A0A917S660_9ACTN|nr:aminotransferase class V-fold PLP-dependent enzyme [Microlunatus endophyticus]GGL60888.1 selenocysteine synthase [Microlunatus endophyticus]
MGVYERFGVAPLINALGTVTVVGGSRMDPRVLEAMAAASGSFVDVPLLLDRAGTTIARLAGAEAACVTSGAAAGLAVATAACLAHGDPERIRQLPDTTGMRDQALVLAAHRMVYDQAVRLAGAELVEVGTSTSTTLEQVDAAITDRTALLFYFAGASGMPGSLPLRDVAALVKPHGIPLVVDAAAELPPVGNLTSFLADGADLVVFSGGKEIGGPQSSGFILGTEPLITECSLTNFPNHSIGRSMKTDKETIVGLVTAVELFVQRDYGAIFARWRRLSESVVAAVNEVPGCTARIGYPTVPGIQPREIPRAYIDQAGLTAPELRDRLLRRKPPVAVGVEGGSVAINPQCLADDELEPLIEALVSELSA